MTLLLNYSRRMSQLAIVNAPSSFTAIWSVMRPWLAKETVEKVNVLGSNYSSYLLELIDPEALPKSLGGQCTCIECGHHHKERPEVGGVDGQVEMGRCAFSSAGPWMAGRTERREAWLRGERDIALRHDELQKFTAEASSSSQPSETVNSALTEHQQQENQDSDTSAEDYSGPSTPALEQQLSQVSVHRDGDGDVASSSNVGVDRQELTKQLSSTEGTEKVREERHETSSPQTSDLQVTS